MAFTVTASGAAPLAYQWRKNGTNIPGETSATLSLAGITTAAGGGYDCVVTNLCGSATSASTTLGVSVSPTVTVSPRPRRRVRERA